jgi:HD superfamily phosphohydrolase YqeK
MSTHLEKCLFIRDKIESARKTAKLLAGDDYDKIMKQYKIMLQEEMTKEGIENPLEAVVKIFEKEVSEGSPIGMVYTLAAAADLIEAEK